MMFEAFGFMEIFSTAENQLSYLRLARFGVTSRFSDTSFRLSSSLSVRATSKELRLTRIADLCLFGVGRW
jgi:hypothetical protein